MRDQVRESRRVTARVISDMARRSSARIRIGERSFRIHELLDDPQLVGALLKIGLFSIGAQSFSDMKMEGFGGRTEPDPMIGIPAGLIGLAFCYALRVTGDGADKDDVRRQAKRIEKVFGPVPLDPILMSEIAALAAAKGET